MDRILIYPKGSTAACGYAGDALRQAGFPLTDHPCPEVTHLLLDVPSFAADGTLRGGGEPGRLLEMLPPSVTVIGGKLDHPALSGYRVFDLLQDPDYLAQNAAITAECALRIAGSMLKTTFADSPALIIGWGRIGKCLARLLRAVGCPVTVAARRTSDRAMAAALGWKTGEIPHSARELSGMRLLFNTAPAPILGAEALDSCQGCLKIDLASAPGLHGSDVIYARGLPGQYAPESSGRLIARTIRRWLEEDGA